MNPQAITDQRIEYECPFMRIYHRRADFQEFSKNYYVVDFKRRGGVVAVRDGSILLVRQYRLLINGESLELPGGTIEDNESAESGLERECLEETGVLVRNLRPVITYYPGLDNVDNRTLVFWSNEVERVRPFIANPHEVFGIEWVPLPDCVDMIFSGRILDAMAVAGILGYALRTQRCASAALGPGQVER